MIEIPDEERIDLVGSFIFLVVAFLFFYQTKRKHRDTPTLTYGFFLAFLGQLLNSITRILLFNQVDYLDPKIGLLLQIIFISALNMILVFFWMFLEYTHGTHIPSGFALLMSALGTAFLSSFFLGIVVFESIELGIAWGTFLFTIFLNIPALRSIFIQNKIYKTTSKEVIPGLQLLAMILIWLWAFLAFISSLLDLLSINYDIITYPEILIDIGDILYYTGLVIFIFTILFKPDYIYRIPLNIQDIVIFSRAGFAVYGIGNNVSEKSLDEQLLAGFITAANGFINEMVPKYDLESIEVMRSTNRIIRLDFGDVIGICTVSNRENWFLRRSVENLVNFIELQNPEPLIEVGSFFEDKVVREWLKIYFPYLAVDSMQTY